MLQGMQSTRLYNSAKKRDYGEQSLFNRTAQLFMRGDSTVVEALLGEVPTKLHEIAVRELKRERYNRAGLKDRVNS